MTVSAFSTNFMLDTVMSLRSQVRSSVVLDAFFGRYVPPTGAAEITFDIEDDALGVLPFVSPLREGKVLPMLGHTTKNFKPAYMKAKTPLNPFAVLSRQMGEKLAGSLSPVQREQVMMVRAIDDHLGRLARSMEIMAIDAIVDGKVTVTGEGYEAQEVNFGRAAGHTKALTSTARWGESGVSPVSDHDDWIMLVTAATGVKPDFTIMDPLAWKLFEADPKLKDRRDLTLAGNNTVVSPGLSNMPAKGAVLKASLDGGTHLIYVYQQYYEHPDTKVATKMVPDYSVMIGTSDQRCQGTRYFGTILDPELGYNSAASTDPASGALLEYAVKTWTTPDPGQRLVMTQAAPLTALTRPNATLYASVR